MWNVTLLGLVKHTYATFCLRDLDGGKCICLGWNAAGDIAKRAIVKYQSPKKRGEASTILTVDEVTYCLLQSDQILPYLYMLQYNLQYIIFLHMLKLNSLQMK